MSFRKVLNGYAAQARYFHSNIIKSTAAGDGEWDLAGWTKLMNGAVKPVYRLLDGTPIVIVNGRTHRDAVVLGIDEADIKATEDACYARVERIDLI